MRTRILTVLLLATASSAHAQDGARAAAAARALFQEGVQCADGQDWACAVERFGRAHALRASPVIASNYGIALTHLGRAVEASEAFRAVLRDATASEALRAHAAQSIDELEQVIGRLTLHASGPTEGLVVLVDGADHTSLLGIAAPCDPGHHAIEARRDGEIVASAAVDVEPAGRVEVDLAIPERPAPAPEEPALEPSVAPELAATSAFDDVPPAEHDEVYEQWWFWVIVGGVALAGAGVTLGVVASDGTTTLPMGSLGTIDARP